MNYKLMDCISDVVSRMILLSFHVSHPSKIVRSTALLLPWLWLHASSPAGEESPGGCLAWPRRHTPWEHRPVVPGHTAPSAGTTCSGLRRAGVARSLPGGSTATSPPCAPGSRRLASRAWPDSLTPPSRDGRPRQASTSPRRSRRASATGPAPAALVQPAGRSSSAALRAPPTPRRSVTRQDDAHGQPGPGALHAWPTPAPATRPGPRNKRPGGSQGRRQRRPASATVGRRRFGRGRAGPPRPRRPTRRGSPGPPGPSASAPAAPQGPPGWRVASPPPARLWAAWGTRAIPALLGVSAAAPAAVAHAPTAPAAGACHAAPQPCRAAGAHAARRGGARTPGPLGSRVHSPRTFLAVAHSAGLRGDGVGDARRRQHQGPAARVACSCGRADVDHPFALHRGPVDLRGISDEPLMPKAGKD